MQLLNKLIKPELQTPVPIGTTQNARRRNTTRTALPTSSTSQQPSHPQAHRTPQHEATKPTIEHTTTTTEEISINKSNNTTTHPPPDLPPATPQNPNRRKRKQQAKHSTPAQQPHPSSASKQKQRGVKVKNSKSAQSSRKQPHTSATMVVNTKFTPKDDTLDRLVAHCRKGAKPKGGKKSLLGVWYLQRLKAIVARNPPKSSQWGKHKNEVVRSSLQLLGDHVHELGVEQVRWAVYCVAKVGWGGRDREARSMLVKVVEHGLGMVGKMSRFQVVNILWSVAAVGLNEVDIAPLVARFREMVSDADGQNCSNYIYSIHKLHWPHEIDYATTLEQFAQLPTNTKDISAASQQHSNILWAASHHLPTPPLELGQLLATFLTLCPSAQPREVSSVLLALQRWCYDEQSKAHMQTILRAPTGSNVDAVARKLVTFVVEKVDEADAQQLYTTLWACGKLGVGDHELTSPLFAAFRGKLDTADAPACAMVLHSAATLGVTSQRFFEVVLHAVLDKVKGALYGPNAPARACANTLWAAATAGFKDGFQCWPLVNRMVFLVQQPNSDKHVEAQDCVNTLWAMAKLDLCRDVKASLILFQNVLKYTDSLSAKQCCNVMYAAAMLSVSTVDSMEGLVTRLVEVKDEWTHVGVTQALLGCQYTGTKQLPLGADLLVDFLLDDLQGLEVQQCSIALVACCDMLPRDDERLRRFVQHYVELSGQVEPRERRHVVQILKDAGFPDGYLIMDLQRQQQDDDAKVRISAAF